MANIKDLKIGSGFCQKMDDVGLLALSSNFPSLFSLCLGNRVTSVRHLVLECANLALGGDVKTSLCIEF
jgi:hypothetical protein